MRSAKMKLITPPKLMPPCQSAAAIGTLPTEHTQLMKAMNGPRMTFSSVVQKPWPVKKTSFHTSIGTITARKPAMPYPMTSSLRSILTSATV